jgi:uncharacterized protein YgbK (DUF1537 family)
VSAQRPLYVWYGDDFTGSTDVLETLAEAGVSAVLFIGPPSPERARAFADRQAIGVAGDSRSRSPEWMTEHLPGVFEKLRALDAPVMHYKVCSTFDSAPHRGSIGRALEIGREVFGGGFTPILVGAPHLRRYVAFGNLFAAAGRETFRIDRHPTMSRHPATPMNEADLRRHLAGQTALKIGLVDLADLKAGRARERLAERLADGCAAVLFDGTDDADLDAAGKLVWEKAGGWPLFAVGSSGVTRSLVPQWRAGGLTAEAERPRPAAVDRMLVVSGSCSPVTEGQIRRAIADGYLGLPVDPAVLLDPVRGGAAAQACVEAASEALTKGRSAVVYTALGPLENEAAAGEALGARLGAMLKEILLRSGTPRAVVAGGDTSSHSVAELGLYALTWAGPLQTGAPLCRAHAESPELDGRELVLKGGQIGSEDFFEVARRGG